MTFPKIRSMIRPVPRSPRGALRDRHERWARDAMDVLGRSALAAPTNDLNADGEVVWS
jgi:hypothetical protein